MCVIVRFECGCIGTAPDSKGHSAILVACDGEGGPGSIDRPMQGKSYSNVPDSYIETLWNKFAEAAEYATVLHAFRLLIYRSK